MVDDVEFEIMDADDQSRTDDDFDDLFGDPRAEARWKAGKMRKKEHDKLINSSFADSQGCY